MLNISDIREKLKRDPIPQEVKDIRSNITERFKNLQFIEEGHKYYLHRTDGTQKEMTSVTTFCHNSFTPKVDWDEILARKALKLGVEKDALGREWKEKNITSTSNGSLTHLFAEGYMYFMMGEIDNIPEVIRTMQYEDGFLIPYGQKQMAVAKYYEDMFKTQGLYPVMPEAQIYIDSEDNPFGITKADISGTFDALFAFQNKQKEWCLSVRDWKTNKSLFNEYNQSKKNYLLPPFEEMGYIDEPKSLYTIQLSLYQIGLQQLGYKIMDRKLLWLTEEGEYHKVDVNDVSKEIINFLQ